MDGSRVSLLISRLRSRITALADFQDQIYEDLAIFSCGDDEAKSKFEETRQRYLGLLNMSVGQLREAMTTEEFSSSILASPTNDFVVEKIKERAGIVSQRYLEHLVQSGELAQEDMDCIIVGGYSSVNEFFDDVYKNVGSFGLHTQGPVLCAYESEKYDEDGFFMEGNNGSETRIKETIPEETTLTSTTKQDFLSSTTRPVVLLPPSEPFNWADDVEDNIETESLNLPSQKPSATGPSPTEGPASPDSGLSSDYPNNNPTCDHDSEMTDHQSSDDNLPDIFLNNEHEQDMNVQPELEDVADGLSTTDTSIQIALPNTTAHLVDANKPDNTCNPKNDSELLETWVAGQDMRYWQWEVVCAILLTARRYKKEFEDARKAYKVNSWWDTD
ncbi:hypothetical protein F4819DRAFT_492645 [Hypoxylon fuscum]|nr:hypothetical protein F4819DRAFT_492645 [Hypoxylon fuscum]